MPKTINGREKNSKFQPTPKRQKQMFDASLKKNIIPVASGKGGVGKTFFTVNLGIAMARQNKKVVIVDLDLGTSNLHTYMGIKASQKGIGEFVQSNQTDLNAYKSQTKIPNLEIIQGDQLIPDLANLKPAQKKKIIEALYDLDNEVILLDLGAGSNANVVDFFLLSNHGILTCTPTHGAVLNGFSFLKTCVYRFFLHHFHDPKYKRIINLTKKKDHEGKYPTFWDVLNQIAHSDRDIAQQFKTIIDQFKPAVVFNMVEDLSDVSLIRQLVDLIHQKILLDLDVLGYIPKHQTIHESVKNRTPLAFYEPSHRGMKNIEGMADQMLKHALLNRPLFDISKYDSSLDQIEDTLRNHQQPPTPQSTRAKSPPPNREEVFRKTVVPPLSSPSLEDVIQKQMRQNMNSLKAMSFGDSPKW